MAQSRILLQVPHPKFRGRFTTRRAFDVYANRN